jgi:hypothetical protein
MRTANGVRGRAETGLTPPVASSRRGLVPIFVIGSGVLGGCVWFLREAPPWLLMWVLAGGEFLLLKLLTLAEASTRLSLSWKIGYVFAWPGMNIGEFSSARPAHVRADGGELLFALGKCLLGVTAFGWAAANFRHAPPLVTGWVAMMGVVFCLHFGGLHLVSWCWRRAGVLARPIMRAPIMATSLAEFWGERWNVAFADAARRLLFRPLARRAGTRIAGLGVFLVSGLVHETVISLPARGGWGGPTLYFLLQAAGMAAEKSKAGQAAGLGRGLRGWTWTLLITALPVPLLFHAPFVERVIVPFVGRVGVLLS